jgi:hypothetical protein
MPARIKKPKAKLPYEPELKVEHKVTTFRLPVPMLKELQEWANACTDDSNNGSLNDLVKTILQWGLDHRDGKK